MRKLLCEGCGKEFEVEDDEIDPWEDASACDACIEGFLDAHIFPFGRKSDQS
jgi:hypothetical protein